MWDNRSVVHHYNTVNIWKHRILCCGNLPVHFGMLSGIPDFYHRPAVSCLVLATENVFRYGQMSPGVWGGRSGEGQCEVIPAKEALKWQSKEKQST